MLPFAAGWQFLTLAQIKYTTAEGEEKTRHYKIERADAEDDIAIIRREAVASGAAWSSGRNQISSSRLSEQGRTT